MKYNSFKILLLISTKFINFFMVNIESQNIYKLYKILYFKNLKLDCAKIFIESN